MPWDRSPDNHLTASQRRDYLMASLGWFRDLLMLGFSLLLLVVTGLLLAGSGFALMPLGGNTSLLPMSLIVIATICMSWTLLHWTAISFRRALLGLVISLSAAWITALACIQGMSHREGVFLRTSKTGGDRHRLRKALRLSRVELALALALYVSALLLIVSAHPPLLLIFIITLQGTVYFCCPLAALWNMRAQRVPGEEFRRRFEQRRLRRARRTRPAFVTGAFAGAMLAAAVAGVGIALFTAPAKLVPVPAQTVGAVPATTPAAVGTVRTGP